jgi:hypothetical protein
MTHGPNQCNSFRLQISNLLKFTKTNLSGDFKKFTKISKFQQIQDLQQNPVMDIHGYFG